MHHNQRDIAVIALNCRFPGIRSLEVFWDVLAEGRAPLNEISLASTVPPGSIPVNIQVDDFDRFDADFFGYTYREAEILDPQQRVFLQLAWEVLEKAGYNPFNYKGLIGLFAGTSLSTYLIHHLLHHPNSQSLGAYQTLIYNEKDYLTSLLAYHLNLQGPCVTVQSACSTSLVAIHMACESLLSGQCDMALAGGISLVFPLENSYVYQDGGLVSKDGRVCAFDASASGTVYSNGTGIVLLKRLEDALRDADSIFAVIKGSAINNDGARRNSFSSPGVDGQSLVIAEALSLAHTPPETVSYVETHGSGTPLGDVIEFEALKTVFSDSVGKRQFCALGSVKTNLGHTQAASGVAGFIKTCLSLYHKKIPPSLNYKQANPKCDFPSSPFYVNTKIQDWSTDSLLPRRASINSFGLGGCNAHLVLEESPLLPKTRESKLPDNCFISAKTERALQTLCQRYIAWLETDHPDLNLNDFAYTTRVGRVQFPHRIALTFSSREQCIEKLKAERDATHHRQTQRPLAISVELGFIPLFSLEELLSLCSAYPALHSLAVDLSSISDFVLNKETETLISYLGLVVVLRTTGIEVSEWIFDDNTKGICVYLALELPLKHVVQLYRANPGVTPQMQTPATLTHQDTFNERHQGDRTVISIGVRTIESKIPPPEERFLNWVNELWLQGIDADWALLNKGHEKKLPLPTYPFEQRRCFVEHSRPTTPVPAPPPSISILVAIKKSWEETMGVQVTDQEDNFFEMGGHSLLATRLLSALEKAVNCHISLQDFLDNPTVGGLEQLVYEQCSKEGHPLLPLPEIVPDPAHKHLPFPLTITQQAYWIGRQSELELGNIATHMYFEKDLLALDLDRFEAALNHCIQRHDMLRAVISDNGTQFILESVERYTIPLYDCSLHPLPIQEKHLSNLREELSHQKINVGRWPLFKIVATRLTPRLIRLHISIDLLIADAWSIEIWLRELGDLYQNPSTVLRPLSISFRDYVLATKQIEKGPLYRESKEYWIKRIAGGFLPPPQLPLIGLPAAITDPRFKRYHGTLTTNVWDKLKEIAKGYHITPPTVLIGAFAEILRTWAKSPDFTLNLTLFNRLPLHPDVNEIIGDFTSLTLLEIKSAQEKPFFERARAIQYQLWNDLEYKYFSGPEATREILKNRDVGSEAFPIVFTSLLGQGMQTIRSPFETSFTSHDTFSVSQTPQVWLDHQVIEREDGLHFNWDVLEGIFPNEMIDSMFQNYAQLLEKLTLFADLWTKKESLLFSILSPKSSIDCTPVREDKGCSLLYPFFQRVAESTPHQLAIITPLRSFTYREIWDLGQQIATHLTACAIESGALVGIAMDKGWEMVVAMVGVLQANGAFLPIDASYPQKRIEEMISVAQIKHLLVAPRLIGQFSQHRHLSILPVRFDPHWNAPPLSLPSVHPDQLAYAFFTSGSTGQPKCVEITHRGIINTLEAVLDRYHVGKEDKVLALSSFSFDLSIFDIFGLFAKGGSIVIPHADQMKDPQAWLDLIEKYHVTVWNTAPALMQMLYAFISSTSHVAKLDSLRLVMCSGDKMPIHLALELKNTYKIPHVVSLGGATEASVWSIWYELDGAEGDSDALPYGKAMPGQDVLVLNEWMQECPMWVEGELYIRGIGLARGYRHHLEETRFRFIEDPYWGRVYRTGDRGRYRDDNMIEFLGRVDHQVKIRGHRVELGEIESKLNKYPQLKSAVVLDYLNEGQKELACLVEVEAHEIERGPSPQGIILNPMERLKFKIDEHGIRKDLSHPPLQLNSSIDDTYRAQFIRRKSSRSFITSKMIERNQLERLCSSLRSIELPGVPFAKRLYGSGGGLYPVQVYVQVKKGKITDIPAGIYYYHPKLHQLVLVSEGNYWILSPFSPNNHRLVETASVLFYLIANLDAIVPMYGIEESQRLIHLEAGMITQLLEMSAADSLIGLCQVGGVDFERIKDQFQLQGTTQFIHSLAGGPIAESQLSVQGIMKDMEEYHAAEKRENGPDGLTTVVAELKEHLKQQLPEYMIPSCFFPVPSLPLNPNGKLDRRACHVLLSNKLKEKKQNAPHFPVSASQSTGQTNATTEQYLSEVWEKVLQHRSFTYTDNFFDVGGNSIALVQIYRIIQEKMDAKFSMIDLFKYPSIRLLSNYLSTQGTKGEGMPGEETVRALSREKAFTRKKEGCVQKIVVTN